MPTPDPYGQGVQIAQLTDAPDAETLARALAGIGSMLPHMVLVYASAAARSAALTGTTAPTAGMTTYLADVGRLECYNGTTWVVPLPATTFTSSGATALAGWSVTSFAGRSRGGIITVNLAIARTGTDIVPGDNGNIPDTAIGTIPTDYAPQQNYFTGVGDGYGSGEAYISTDGTVTLRAWVPGGVITVDRNICVSATYVNE